MERSGYEIVDISAAVLVGSPQMSPEQTQAYKEMVAFASGIAPEKVVFSSAEFLSGDEGVLPGDKPFEPTKKQP